MSKISKPEWLKIRLSQEGDYRTVQQTLHDQKIHTICQSGACPNQNECWKNGTATFMILGDICTRSCKFCNVSTGKPLPTDPGEPQRIAESVKALNLRHCVITSVDRDDLPDLGAKAWADTIRAIKSLNPQTTLETLVPDFQGNTALAQAIIEAGPEIISHNMETVRRLTPLIRSAAGYDRSLALLRYFAGQQATVKSGIMLGLGEKHAEVLETMDDLVSAGCSIMTIGQYLQPTRSHYPVMEYVHPDRFAEYKTIGLSKGFRIVESAPLVRSSYHAEKHVR